MSHLTNYVGSLTKCSNALQLAFYLERVMSKRTTDNPSFGFFWPGRKVREDWLDVRAASDMQIAIIGDISHQGFGVAVPLDGYLYLFVISGEFISIKNCRHLILKTPSILIYGSFFDFSMALLSKFFQLVRRS